MMPFIDGDLRFSERPPDWDERYAASCALLQEEDRDRDTPTEDAELRIEEFDSSSDSSPSLLLDEATKQYEQPASMGKGGSRPLE